MDQFTERTGTGFMQNLGGSLVGVLIGFLLLIGSIILIWWNEGESVKQADALEQMRDATVVLHDARVNTANDGKPVWVYGRMVPTKQLKDATFGVTSDGLVLERNVQMYQWRESSHSSTEKKLGGGTETVTTYTYEKEWSPSVIHSSNFKNSLNHQNPQEMPYKFQRFTTDAKLGEFYIPSDAVSTIQATQELDLSNYPQNQNLKTTHRYIYIGKNPDAPEVGDVRISYRVAVQGEYSVVAKQSGNVLNFYTSSNGRKLFFAQNANISPEKIFENELHSNMLKTWLFRGGGLLLMFFGFLLIMGPLSALANVIPIFGSIVEGTTAFIAFVLTLVLGAFIIALAWFGARPIMSLFILAAGAAIAFWATKFGKRKIKTKEGTTAATPPPRRTPPPRKSDEK